MTRLLVTCLLVSNLFVVAQTSVIQETKNESLRERYQALKRLSTTFEEYKVINEAKLNEFWKITQDSLNKEKSALKEANATIANLENDKQTLQTALDQKNDSMEETVHASTHINVLGIDFSKIVFIALVAIVIFGLMIVVGLMSGSLRVMYNAMKEKIDLLTNTTSEYEEYKRKALEKQSKLARELQTERNRMMEMKMPGA